MKELKDWDCGVAGMPRRQFDEQSFSQLAQ
jgi:hypothetical protein